MPPWATACWAIGVWVSLIDRSWLLARLAPRGDGIPSVAVGAAASFAYQFTSDRPASIDGFGNTAMPIVHPDRDRAAWYYTRRITAAGVLR